MDETINLVNELSESQVKAIEDAHLYTWAQMEILALITSYISDIRNDRANITNIEYRSISLEGYLIHGKHICEVIKDIRFREIEAKRHLYTIAKNFFRGTTHPIYEITKDENVKELIMKLCFEDTIQFQSFFNVLTIIRHFLSHNYTEHVIIKNWDLRNDSVAAKLKKETGGLILFKYNGSKYFPEAYKEEPFEIDISLNLDAIEIGKSLFDAIQIRDLFFLGELCNNSLFKTINTIKKNRRSGIEK